MRLFSLSLAIIALIVPPACAQGFRLVLNSPAGSDTAHFVFDAGATTGFDPSSDQVAQLQTGNGRNYISSDGSVAPLSFNNVPMPDYSWTVPVSVFVQSPGNCDFLLEAESSIPAGTRFVLETLWTGPVVELTPGQPVQQFLLANSISDPPAYVLHVFPAPQVSTSPVSCDGSSDGSLHVSFGNSTNWIMNVYDSAPTLLYSFIVAGHDTTLPGFTSDNYSIGFGGPEFFTVAAAISSPAPVDATFSLATDSIQAGQQVIILNNADPNFTSSWDFGDGSGTFYGSQPWFMYSSPGSYIITQTVTSPSGCTGTFGHKIEVMPGITTAIGEAIPAGGIRSFYTEGTLHLVPVDGKPFNATVFSADGKLAGFVSSSGPEATLSLPEAGIYFVSTQSVQDGESVVKTIYAGGQ
jgi:hypothetical protein